MGTEVLRPENVLSGRLGGVPQTASFHRRRKFNADLTNLDVSKKQNNSGSRKTSPKHSKRKLNADVRRKDEISSVSPGPVMGKVKLLRRGESLSSIVTKLNDGVDEITVVTKSVDDMSVCISRSIRPIKDDRDEISVDDKSVCISESLRPQPTTRVGGGGVAGDVYAGMGAFESPSPRSLPLPSFFGNKGRNDDCGLEKASLEDGGTEMLRRLLRIK